MTKKALLLVNVGTPDKPTQKYVRKFLTSFLNDLRVIDLPWLLQKFLVNVIIIPLRNKNSTQLYKLLWTKEGSPLMVYLKNLEKKLQFKFGNDYHVFGVMRYENPSLLKTLKTIKEGFFTDLVVLPLFPQYASSTSGTVSEYVMKEIKKWNIIPNIRIINQFYEHPLFIEAFARRITSYKPETYDHILFSYHGLPNRHLDKSHPGVKCTSCNCDKGIPEHGKLCYRATCYETTRLIAQKLGLDKNKYTTTFQSRLSKNWMTPFTDETLVNLAKTGTKKVLVTTPAFVADCLETIVEINVENGDLFKKSGGEALTLVESLNDTDDWVNAVVEIIK